MRKISIISKLAAVLLLSGTAFAANAQTAIEEGVAFKPERGEVYTFTPSISGDLTVNVGAAYYYVWSPMFMGTFLYENPECTEYVYISSSDAVGDYETNYIIKGLTGGQTYYFRQDQYPGRVDFVFTMKENNGQEPVTSVTPSTSKPFNYVSAAEILVEGNSGFTSVGDVTISYDGNTETLDPGKYFVTLNGPPQQLFLQIGGVNGPDFKKLITNLANEGVSSFTITINDLMANGTPVSLNETGEEGVTVEDGKVTLTYQIIPAPKYLPDQSYWFPTFYSYWQPKDPAGIVKLKFDQNISYVDEVKLIMGHAEFGSETGSTYDEYIMNDYVTVNGNEVSIDFTGVKRESSQSQVTISVTNVVGVNGMPVDMTQYGTVLGLFSWIPYSAADAPAPEPGPSVETLAPATVFSGLIGDYMCGEWGASDLDIQYKENGEAVTVQFVNPLTGYYEWDEAKEEPYQYANVTLNMPGKSMTIKALLAEYGGGIGGMSVAAQDDENGSNTLSFKLSELYDMEWVSGDYSIEIPEGIVKNSEGVVNPAQSIAFKMVAHYAYVSDSQFNPMPMNENSAGIYNQQELKAVTIDFGTPIVKNVGEISYSAYGEFDQLTLAAENVTINNDNMVLNLSGLAEGTYSFDIPTGYLVIDGDAINASISFTYNVWNGMKPGEMVLGPAPVGQWANNIELYYGEPIELAMENPEIDVYEDWYSEWSDPAFSIPSSKILVLDIPLENESGEGEDSMSVLYLNIASMFDGKYGTFIVDIPAGLVKNAAGQLNPAQQITFTLAKIYDVVPEVTVSEAGIVSVVWAGADYVSSNEGITPYVVCPDGTRETLSWYDSWFGTGEIETNASYDGIDINLSSFLTEEGDYEIVLPEGYLNISYFDEATSTYGSGINNEVVYTVKYENGETSGVNTIGAAVENVIEGIYNLQGVKVNKDLNGLSNGIYIINGKKVMIRK